MFVFDRFTFKFDSRIDFCKRARYNSVTIKTVRRINMRKSVKFASVVLSAVTALSLAACARPQHKHLWDGWGRSESEHWRVCACGAESEHVGHEGGICADCADFKILAFGDTNGGDPAHNDFVKDANKWFPEQGKQLGFLYEFNGDWNAMTEEYLSKYDLVMFLNNIPGSQSARTAFRNYMENGGAWMGFHVCAFSMNDNMDEWQNWYHNEFLGSGNFWKNTWNPTRNMLKVETSVHYSTQNLPETFMSAYNEWYNWENDLRENPDITILLSIDKSGYPVGDKPGETWNYNKADPDDRTNFCPVAWSNDKYNMIYVNMGHNLQDYNTYEKQSSTFEKEEQNRFMLDAITGLAETQKNK